MSVIILHPENRISPIQEAQMTSVLDENVHNLAVDGTFDDCQDFVKALFGDEDINRTHKLAAINSINWARMAPLVIGLGWLRHHLSSTVFYPVLIWR